MRGLRYLALAICAAFPAAAQEDDRSFLQGLLEDNLSSAGREVRIEGFEGALSSQATLQKLTIADEDGIWLTLSEAQLDWSRAALLKGRLEVTALTAKSIDLPRLPAPGDEADSDSGRFALPELPVAVSIDKLQAQRVSLGAPVLGQSVVMSLLGSVRLEGGEGAAELSINRLDRRGQIALTASYGNDTRELALDLSVDEEEGGLLASLARLPGTPAVAFTTQGTGVIDDYRAVISLSSDGKERLGGVVGTKLLAETGARQIAASLSGDMTPLFAPDLRPFFGPDVNLNALTFLESDGRVLVETFALTSAQMSLAGEAQIAAGGLPERLSVQGKISGDGPVRLPTSGPAVLVDRVVLAAQYDRTAGDRWTLQTQVDGLQHDALTLARMQLSGQGTLQHDPQAATANLAFETTGLAMADPALARALGKDLTGTALLSWQAGSAPLLQGIALNGKALTLALTGAVALSGSPSGQVSGQASAPDLSRFAGLVGRPISGAIRAQLADARFEAGGAVTVDLTAQAQNLTTGVAPADDLLRGTADLAFKGGLGGALPEIKLLKATTQQVSLTAAAQEDGSLAVDATLNNLGLLAPGLPGALQVQGTVKPDPKVIGLDVSAAGPAGLTLKAAGRVATDASTSDLAVTGAVPLALANGFIAPRTALGTAQLDLRLQGVLGLEALRGTIRTTGARVADPAAYLVLQDVAANLALADAAVLVDVTAQAESGGRVATEGRVGLTGAMTSDLTVTLDDLVLSDGVLFTTLINGDVGLKGPLQGGALISGGLTLGRTEVRVGSSSAGAGGPIPQITHKGEPLAVRQTRARAGLLQDQDGTGGRFGLDIAISAPNQIFLRGSGLEAELGGALRLAGTTETVIPSGQFQLIRGRLDLIGQRLTMTEGLATLQGSMDPFVRLVAETSTADITARVTVEGVASDPALTFSSDPDLPEDEVLAQLLFGREASSLSPFQAAQLAAAVSGLSGGASVVGRLRESFGLDDLDVVSDGDGGTSVTAGKYLSDNLYTDVTVGSGGTSEINLNLDLSPSVTVKGGVDSAGNSDIGVFFQRDY